MNETIYNLTTGFMSIWISIIVVCILLTTIEIVEKRIKGIPNKISVCACKNLFLYFGSILGKGFDIPSLPAIRISVGVWFLKLVVLCNLFGCVLKANYVNKGTTNINSMEDVLRSPNLVMCQAFADESCQTSEQEVVNFCRRFRPCSEFKRSVKDKFVLYMEFFFATTFFVTSYHRKSYHISSMKYNYKPLVFMVKKTVHPEALELINKRVLSFFETSQFIPNYRYKMWFYGADFRYENECEFQKIGMTGFLMQFALWAALLGAACQVLFIEILMDRYLQ